MASSANDQAPAYYQQDGKPLHWDLVIMYHWDYFQSQVTKYLMRWKTKHKAPADKLQDLQKARHFLDKYIENYREFMPTQPPEWAADLAPEPLPMAEMELRIRPITKALFDYHRFSEQVQVEGYMGNGSIDFRCKKCRWASRQPGPEEFIKVHNEAASPGCIIAMSETS